MRVRGTNEEGATESQCDSANEDEQHGCQGLPGTGQTELLGAGG